MISRRTTRFAALTALPAALMLGVAVPASAQEGDAHQIDLTQLSDSGSSGTAFLSVEGNELTVKIEAEGLTPNSPHAQHLHGSTEGKDFRCPTPEADKDGDGIVSTPEGIPSYGDIMISLTTDGDTSKDSGLAVDRMPKADANGELSYERTLEVSDDVAEHIKDLHLVQHGLDANDNGKYDTDAGESPLDPKLPLEATAPAACGMVKGAAIGSMPVGGVETGGAGTGGTESPALIAAGGAGLVGAAGALVFARRRQARLDA